MTTLIEIENTPDSKKLIAFLKTMPFVKIVNSEEVEEDRRTPNKATRKAIQEVKSRKVNAHKSAKDLFKKLDA